MTLTEFEALTVETIETIEDLAFKGLVQMCFTTKGGDKYKFMLPDRLYRQLRNKEAA